MFNFTALFNFINMDPPYANHAPALPLAYATELLPCINLPVTVQSRLSVTYVVKAGTAGDFAIYTGITPSLPEDGTANQLMDALMDICQNGRKLTEHQAASILPHIRNYGTYRR